MTDLDGTVTNSPIVNITCERVTNKISAGPNPFTRSVTIFIESITRGPATITWYDAAGRMLSQRKVQLQDGNNQVSYDGMGNLPAGAYYLRVVYQNKVEHFKLIKTGK